MGFPNRTAWGLLLLALALPPIEGCGSAAARCSVCDRTECSNLAITVAWDTGELQRTCCPRCGARLIASKGKPSRVTVRDFDTARPIPAERAVFVEGSDVHPCRGVRTEPLRSAEGCCLLPEYDRCEPSVVPFADEDAARRFMAVHGGTVVSWSSLAAASASR